MNKFTQNIGMAWVYVTDVLDRALGSIVSGRSDGGDEYCNPYQAVANDEVDTWIVFQHGQLS